MKNIAIIGSSGALGSEFTRQLSMLHPNATIHAFSRHGAKAFATNVLHHLIDYSDEESIAAAASIASKETAIDMVVVATGILHDGDIRPEKSLRELSAKKFHHLFEANTILPALIAKHFIPGLNQENRSIFAVMTARVGSISDNHLGGWYAYRASKAALNMIIKNTAIEIGRRNKQAIIVGLHPGTVDSSLSKPFQVNIPDGKLFTPDFSVKKLLEVLEKLIPEHTGQCFDWDGKEIKP